jgi:HAD superfamily phosphoserine phosphatase-like hydrolase
MKKIICFDVNGTLIEEKSWEVLTCGRKDIEKKIEENFDAFYRKEIAIDEAWSILVGILKDAGISSRDYMYKCWEGKVNFKEGAEEIISYLKEKGYKIYLISCSIDAYLNHIAREMGLDGVYAGSHLMFDDSSELVLIESECMEGSNFKKKSLERLVEEEEASVQDIVFVGDGDNDIEAFKMTGHGIAMGSKSRELLKNSWKQIDNLLQIKEIL